LEKEHHFAGTTMEKAKPDIENKIAQPQPAFWNNKNIEK